MLSGARVVVVDPFGSECFGLAIVTGRAAIDGPASVICVLDKRSRAVEIGGALEVAVARRAPEALTAADREGAALAGELSCGFEAEDRTLLLTAGNVASEEPAEAVVRLAGGLSRLGAPGGFDAILDGATFTGEAGSAQISVTGVARDGGESPARAATLTLQPRDGDAIATEGLWRCGP